MFADFCLSLVPTVFTVNRTHHDLDFRDVYVLQISKLLKSDWGYSPNSMRSVLYPVKLISAYRMQTTWSCECVLHLKHRRAVMVEPRRIELLTSCVQGRRSPS